MSAMLDALKTLFKQPYWVIALVLGVVLVALPCVTIDKDNHWATHPPSALLPAAVGIGLLLLSAVGFAFTLWTKPVSDETTTSLDLTRVKESNGIMSTNVDGCEVRVVEGRLEDYAVDPGIAVVLPCNEYFDDRCVEDTKSALGAYVNRTFEGQVDQFISLVNDECGKRLGPGVIEQKTGDESAESFGAGRCLLLLRPLVSCPRSK